MPLKLHSIRIDFNDLRYTIDSSKLKELGWKESVSWLDGLNETIDWYKCNSSNWGDISSCLVPHPRLGSPTGGKHTH